MSEKSETRRHAELLVRTRNLNDDIKLVKTHQWQATYYSLLLSAGTIGLASLVVNSNSPCSLQLVLIAATLVQAVVVFVFHCAFRRSLSNYRKHGRKLDHLLNKQTGVFEEIREGLPDQKAQDRLSDAQTCAFIMVSLFGPIATVIFVIAK